MSSPVIAVDLDDVLASSAQGFVDYSNKRWGTRLTVEDYNEHWSEMWGIEHEETIERAHDIYASRVQRDFIHDREAALVLKDLAKRYKLVITTSRHRQVQQDTLDWLEKHFPEVFSDVHFAGIWEDWGQRKQTLDEAAKLTKADLLKKIGAAYIIDDHPKHCNGAAKVGVQALLFGDYGWNRHVKLAKGIIRVKDWSAVKKFFDELA